MANSAPKGNHFVKKRTSRRRFWGILAVSIVVLLLLGAGYESVSELLDVRRFPPPGHLVDMGGYSLHLYCTGQGSPTVILEGGLGGGVATWPLVQQRLAGATARVCAYDRSGWAWSTGSPPATGRETVDRLHTLLERAGVTGPYILVGHSLGGLYSQLYAATYPDQVAGMVLVEARHPDFTRDLEAATGRGSSASQVANLVAPVVTRLGLTRIMSHFSSIGRKLPPGMLEVAIHPSSQATAKAERNTMQTLETEVRAAQLSLDAKPLVVVTRDGAVAPGAESRVWFETQHQLLTLSTRSSMIEAKGSGHLVPYDNPDVVAEAILKVLQEAPGR